MRALFAGPPLTLSAFALTSAALLGERLAGAHAPLAPLLFWIGIATAFGAFWLWNALRLAGLVASPPGRLGSAGALATAVLGAILAGADPAGSLGGALALTLSAACFSSCFLLHVGLRRS
jgi:hypothetical protein